MLRMTATMKVASAVLIALHLTDALRSAAAGVEALSFEWPSWLALQTALRTAYSL